ncbi:unnamed protein product [Laminaria digitata]
MSNSAFLSAPPSHSVLDRRSGVAKNRLLNLAFEDGSRSHHDADNPEEPKSVPADVFKQGIREHAVMMGMLLPEDEDLLWIAEESLLAPLPEGWVQLKDDQSGHPYYYNQTSGDSSWDHPRDGFYKEIYRQKKASNATHYFTSTPVPPEPPVRTFAGVAPKYTGNDEDIAIRYGKGVEEPPDDGDSACGGDDSCDTTETRSISSEEVLRLRRQLERSKESRKIMAEEHDEAVARLERAKEDLEERLETAADELRQQRRRFSTATLERERVEKMSTKLKETTRELENRLEKEAQLSGERACTVDDLRNEAEAYKRQLAEASAQAEANLAKQVQSLQRRLLEANEQSEGKIEELNKTVEGERRALSMEAEQSRAKMDFQVDERIQEATEIYKSREESLMQDVELLRVAVQESKQELAKTKSAASAAAAAISAKLAETVRASEAVSTEGRCRKDLEQEVARLTGELEQADIRFDALSKGMPEMNKLVERVSELQNITEEVQGSLRAANERFNEEVARRNADVANAEDVLEKRIEMCKKLESAVDDAKADREKAEALVAAERAEVKRLSMTTVSTEASLTEAHAKVEFLSRQLEGAQQQLDASEGLERDLQRLGREAEEMQRKADHSLEEKQREVEVYRIRVDEGDVLSRKLMGSLAEVEGRALQEKGAAERLMARISSLEAQVLEGRAVLATAEADRGGIVSELSAAKDAVGCMEEVKAEVAAALTREDALRVEIAAQNNALKAVETTLERERQAWSEARTDLQKRAEGAEGRAENLQCFTKDLTQKLRDMEQRLQKELEKSKERESEMWAQLQQVSSKFAEASSRNKDGESTFGEKVDCLEARLRKAENQALESQAECARVKEDAERDTNAKDAEVELLKERISRKKDKFASQKLALETESKALSDRLAEARVVEEGIRTRCTEVVGRNEHARAELARFQDAKNAADQEAAGARAEAAGLKSLLDDERTRLQHEIERLHEDAVISRQAFQTEAAKNEAERWAAEESKGKAEAKCKVMEGTADRLEGDLARLTAQVAAGNIDRGAGGRGDSQEVTALKFKAVETQASFLSGEIQQLSSKLAMLMEEKRALDEKVLEANARYSQLEAASSQSRLRYDRIQEENEGNRRLVTAAREEAEEWKTRFEAERALRRALNAKLLDMQGSIRVLCRLRPLQQAEITAIDRDMEYEDPMASITYPDVDRLTFWGVPYHFDYVFGPGTEQAQVFDEVQPIVASALEGYRVCVFAYGQTGSGKTYTMEGPKADRGVNFRALAELFALSARDEGKEFQFMVSMLEVYNESVKDLFVEPGRPSTSVNKHDIRLDKRGKVYVEGLVECVVETLEEVEELVILGGRNRTVGNNNVNEHSSRSHLVLQVQIVSTDLTTGYVQHGRLNLIDLAGSERIKARHPWKIIFPDFPSTAAEGQQLKEAQNINRSLSALGDVINALGSGSKHVPYRNSKLTFLLQDSLSSNAKASLRSSVLMFVNINPAPQSQGESSCSLNFAKRCRAVQLGTSRRLGAR